MEDKVDYNKIIDFIKTSGDRLKTKCGNIADIGISKINLTEEDLAIERGFNEIITSFGDDHVLYAEEENANFQNFDNVWIADPISGTKCFIKGEPHYSIVIAHMIKNKVVFSAVYDPSVDEFYTAFADKGAFLNGKPISVGNGKNMVILRPSSGWKEPEVIKKVETILTPYEVERNTYSLAVNYCWVASGRFDAIASFTKDSFPEFAGGFILQQAGGIFTNIDGKSDIVASDRIFIGGNKDMYETLFPLIKKVV
jgi:myo-inositol-1(or 4)-monophosphatase